MRRWYCSAEVLARREFFGVGGGTLSLVGREVGRLTNDPHAAISGVGSFYRVRGGARLPATWS